MSLAEEKEGFIFFTEGGRGVLRRGTGPPLPGSAIPAVHYVHRLFRSKFCIV